MKIKDTHSLLGATLGLFSALATGLAATSVLSEDFSDINLAGSWFSNRTTLSVTNETLFVPGTQSNQFGTYFSPTSLQVGESIRLTFDMTFAFPEPQSDAHSQFRVGLFHSDGQAQPVGFGSGGQPVDGGTVGYQGFGALFSPLHLGSSNVRISHRHPEQGTQTALLTQAGTWQSEGSGSYEDIAYLSNTVYGVVFAVTRNGDDTADIYFSIGNEINTHERTVSSTLFTFSPTFTFDTLGMYLDGTTGDVTLDNFDISVIPEPGTYALFGGLLVAGAVLLRRLKRQ